MLALGHQVCEDVPVSGGQAPRVAVRASGPWCLTDAPGLREAVMKPTGLHIILLAFPCSLPAHPGHLGRSAPSTESIP